MCSAGSAAIFDSRWFTVVMIFVLFSSTACIEVVIEVGFPWGRWSLVERDDGMVRALGLLVRGHALQCYVDQLLHLLLRDDIANVVHRTAAR